MSAITPEFYVPGSSWLYRLDPRTKMCFTLLAVVLCTVTGNLAVLFGVLVVTQVVLLVGGLPVRRILGVWRSLVPLIAVILLLQPLLTPVQAPPLWQIWRVRITERGLLMAVRYGARIAAAAFAALVPVLTTRINTLVRGLERSGLPHTWAMAIGLALRYLSTIGDLYTNIKEAQQARGWDPSRGHFVERARRLVPTLIALIVASLRLSDLLAFGLAARGFGLGMEKGRSHWRDVHFTTADWLAFTLMLLAFGGVIVTLYAV